MTEELVTVELRRSVGPRRGPLYGPGTVKVPASFARALGLTPVRATGREEAQGAGSDLPDDFPGRNALIAAGYTTLEAVQAIDFAETKVPGVGRGTIPKIAAYFAE